MKSIFFVLVFAAFSVQAHADCSTKEVLTEEGDYLACEITMDGVVKKEQIPDSACAAHCQLQSAKNKIDTLEEFKKLKKITVKPGEAAKK